MSDKQVRDLERRLTQSGALDDEVALIRERLRVGLIDSHALDVAADSLGYPAAQVVLCGAASPVTIIDHSRFSSELHVIAFTDVDGHVHPLGVKGAAVLANEAARLLDTSDPVDPRGCRLLESVRNIYHRMNGARKRTVHPLGESEIEFAAIVRQNWHAEALNRFADRGLVLALMVMTVQYVQFRSAAFEEILGCFLREAPLGGFSRDLRLRWFRTAMMQALIPELLGIPSLVPHPPDLSFMTPHQQ